MDFSEEIMYNEKRTTVYVGSAQKHALAQPSISV